MFHVPEQYRISEGRMGSTAEAGNNGAFQIPNKGGATTHRVSLRKHRMMFVVASAGEGWEHVSVHVYDAFHEIFYIPDWNEMCYIKELFWDPEDVVMQLHPKKSEYVNNHKHVLHLWRPIIEIIPTPPSILVGVR